MTPSLPTAALFRWVAVGSLVTGFMGGCSGPSDVDEPTGPLPTGDWISHVVADPAAFDALMKATDRDGWVALHENDAARAAAAFGAMDAIGKRSRARAEWTHALAHDDLAKLSGVAHERLFSAWDQRGGLPEGSLAPVVAWLSSRCSGGDGKRWEAAAEAVIGPLPDDGDPWGDPPDSEAPAAGSPGDTLRQRMMLHRAAHAGDRAPLETAARKALFVEDGDGFQRRWFDPCLHRSLSDSWMNAALADLGAADWRGVNAWAETSEQKGLEGTLFAGWLSAADLSSEVAVASGPGELGATAPSLVTLGIPMVPPDDDDAQSARDEVRLLDENLDRLRRDRLATASDDGRALMLHLHLVERYRQELLVSRARYAESRNHPHRALAYLEQAFDVAERDVGSANSPALLALTALTLVETGHTREALDSLETLSAAMPEVVGDQEIVGDLAVQEGLDRRGDSKEN